VKNFFTSNKILFKELRMKAFQDLIIKNNINGVNMFWPAGDIKADMEIIAVNNERDSPVCFPGCESWYVYKKEDFIFLSREDDLHSRRLQSSLSIKGWPLLQGGSRHTERAG
jgi:hypothetical protein